MLHLLREKRDEAVILGEHEEKRPMDTPQEICKMTAIGVRRGALQQSLPFWRAAIAVIGSKVLQRILRGMDGHGWRLAIANIAWQARRRDVARPPTRNQKASTCHGAGKITAEGRLFIKAVASVVIRLQSSCICEKWRCGTTLRTGTCATIWLRV
jgi:hypothetical protein